MKLVLPPLMAIVDADVARGAGWTMVDLAAAFVNGGATLLQVRVKQASSGWFLDIASAIVTLAHQARALVIVNDRADIARLSGADGVHVGQEDLAPAAIRAIVGPTAIVGVSTHTLAQVDAAVGGPISHGSAASPVSYIAIGPVFGTVTKDTGYGPVSLDGVRDAASRTRPCGLPLVAIGGVTLETAAEAIRAGADTVAVIGDLVATDDPATRVRRYLDRLTV